MDRVDLLARFGQAVKKHRSERGFSQEAFAEVLGMHRTQLGHIEQGVKDCRLSTIWRISRALDVPLSELLAGADQD